MRYLGVENNGDRGKSTRHRRATHWRETPPTQGMKGSSVRSRGDPYDNGDNSEDALQCLTCEFIAYPCIFSYFDVA